ncbi:hypothetical protein [Longispora albida]|uniref:HflX-like GTP-binding protein n=1 Tax=Longispora albida TaxID=203523 RepID=UPI00058C836E|nr:hypothetical protein [Longispora albida]
MLIAGLFSAKVKEPWLALDDLAALVESMGGTVAGRFLQRRGISGGRRGDAPGGRANLDQPYSSRTLMSHGKIREIAAAQAHTQAVAVVFCNDVTDRQRRALEQLIGCPVLSRAALDTTKPKI